MVLLGVESIKYDSRTTQYEFLFKLYRICGNNIAVNDVAIDHGGG